MKEPKVYVIILNYNNWWDTIECLESVLKNDYPNYHVIVVDNNSPNRSVEYIKAWAEGKLNIWINPKHPLRNLSFPPIQKPICYKFIEYMKGTFRNKEENCFKKNKLIIIKTNKNLGYAKGINVALKYIFKLEKDLNNVLIWLLNPDIIPQKNCILNIVECVKLYKYRKVILGTPVYNYFKPKEVLYFGGARIYKYLGIIKYIQSYSDIKFLDYISGGNLIAIASSFKDIGLFSEDYFLYWEDADWCFRAKKKGYKLIVCNNCIVFDKGGTSINRTSELAYFFYLKNYLIFHEKFYNSKLKLIFYLFLFVFRIPKAILKKNTNFLKATLKLLKEILRF